MHEVKIHKVLSANDLNAVFAIRQTVFVEEQAVDPELEYDEFEDTSTHFIALVNGIATGTARWRKTPNGIKLERFAVLAEYRSNGIGDALIKTLLNDLPSTDKVYLHAQLRACSLYRRNGFKEEGDQFEEANIQHYKMVYHR